MLMHYWIDCRCTHPPRDANVLQGPFAVVDCIDAWQVGEFSKGSVLLEHWLCSDVSDAGGGGAAGDACKAFDWRGDAGQP